jgi:hypothetical protein
VITLDGYAASHRAVAKLKTSGILQRVRPDARVQTIRDGCRDFLRGIELAAKIKKITLTLDH